PGTGWPEPGGLLPREALRLVRLVSEPGLAGLEVVECSPPYDQSELTSLLAARVVLDCLATQVREGRLGRRPAALPRRGVGAGAAVLSRRRATVSGGPDLADNSETAGSQRWREVRQ